MQVICDLQHVSLRAQPARKYATFKAGRRSSNLEVMGQFMHFDGVNPCFLKILHRHLLAPRCAEAIAALRQRHRHGMPARNRVKQGTDRVLPVMLDVARGSDVLRRVDSIVGQQDPNAAQDISRAGLVVNGVEGGDEVKSTWLACWSKRLRSRAMKFTFFFPVVRPGRAPI